MAAHEPAHQRFGNKVTCGSWQDIWLNKGFPTPLVSMYMEEKYTANTIANRNAEVLSITSNSVGVASNVRHLDRASADKMDIIITVSSCVQFYTIELCLGSNYLYTLLFCFYVFVSVRKISVFFP
ncbi:hypothetical protein L0659_24945 [Dyadobacter sp. CY347]|nr:hypothetical protein [Dyadobacter sp. CY347]